jgi:hypothetical protein
MSDVGGILQEHQAPDKIGDQNNPLGYQPTPEEKQTIKLANRLFDKAKRFRKTFDQDWLDNYKFFRGKQWKEQRPTYRHSEVINMVFSAIQSTVPIQLDSRPRIEYLPQNPADTELSTILSDLAESDWDRNNWLMTIAEMLYDGNLYGNGMAEMPYDPKAEFGLGAIAFDSVDPLYCFPDPEARNVNKRSKYFCYAEPVDVETLKGDHPKYAEFIKPDLEDLLQGNKQDLNQVRFKSPTDTKVIMEGDANREMGNTSMALKLTIWLKSDEYVEEEKLGPPDEAGVQQKVYEQKLKYPNGRKIVIAGGVLVEDGPNPYEDGKFPYVRWLNYILPREFWGMSEIEQLKGPQKIFNKLLSFALDIYTLMGNPIWVVDTTSGIDTDNLFNRPGLVVEKEPGTEARRESGVDVSPTLLALVDRMRSWFNETSGSTDLSRGVDDTQITAASAITALQEAAQTRLRQKSRNLDATLQELGQMYLSRVFQFYDSPRVVRITKNENAKKYFQFHIETQKDEQGEPVLKPNGDPVRMATVSQFLAHPETGQPMQSDPKQYMIEGNFDVKVSTGSSLPFAKAQRSNLTMKLFQMGAIDRGTLLKNVEFPNWEQVAQHMEQLDQQKQQMAMQMQAQKPQGGGP